MNKINQDFKTYENITAWKKGMELVKLIYILTSEFPKSEQFGLSSQMQRCAVSIPSNIAEGYRRGTAKEFAHFLRFSYGSGAELETQLKVAQMLNYGNLEHYKNISMLLDEVMRLLHTMLKNPKEPLA